MAIESGFVYHNTIDVLAMAQAAYVAFGAELVVTHQAMLPWLAFLTHFFQVLILKVSEPWSFPMQSSLMKPRGLKLKKKGTDS